MTFSSILVCKQSVAIVHAYLSQTFVPTKHLAFEKVKMLHDSAWKSAHVKRLEVLSLELVLCARHLCVLL